MKSNCNQKLGYYKYKKQTNIKKTTPESQLKWKVEMKHERNKRLENEFLEKWQNQENTDDGIRFGTRFRS